jgi:hypothetical protein
VHMWVAIGERHQEAEDRFLSRPSCPMPIPSVKQEDDWLKKDIASSGSGYSTVHYGTRVFRDQRPSSGHNVSSTSTADLSAKTAYHL